MVADLDINEVQEPVELDEIKVEEVTEPTRKKRGRKPKSDDVTAEPAPSIDDNQPKRKTRRKVNANAVAQIIGIHKMLSMLPGFEIFEIQENEATILAEAMSGIAEEYGVAISGKTGATLNMLAALAMVYGPRVMALHQMNKVKSQQSDVVVLEPVKSEGVKLA